MAEKTLGKYTLLDKVGEGGFGVVYKALDPILEREVAIKVMHSFISDSPSLLDRFRREARLTAALNHPHIVRVIEVGENEGRYFLVMEYIQGAPLSTLLVGGTPLPLQQVIDILKPVAEALDYAHEKGVVHRDVKPSNILIDTDGRPVLTDFGLVKLMQEESTTTTGSVMGTVEYMSPEQILGKPVSAQTDLYALGVIAYQMLAGQTPFSGMTPYEVQNRHVQEPPAAISGRTPAVSPEVSNIVLHLLDKDPGQRYASGVEFIQKLERAALEYEGQSNATLLNEAKQLMEAGDFETGIILLKEETSQEFVGVRQECERRKQISEVVKAQQSQKLEIENQLSKIYSEEEWLNRPFQDLSEKSLDEKRGDSNSNDGHDEPNFNNAAVVIFVVFVIIIILKFSQGY